MAAVLQDLWQIGTQAYGVIDSGGNSSMGCEIDRADTLFDLVEKYCREKRQDVYVSMGSINDKGEDVYADKPIMCGLNRVDSLHPELCHIRILDIDSRNGDKWRLGYVSDMWIQRCTDPGLRDHHLYNVRSFREYALREVNEVIDEMRDKFKAAYEACAANRPDREE